MKAELSGATSWRALHDPLASDRGGKKNTTKREPKRGEAGSLQDYNIWQRGGIIRKCGVHVVREDVDINQLLCAIEGEHQQTKSRRCHGCFFRRAVDVARVVVTHEAGTGAGAGVGAGEGQRLLDVEQSPCRHGRRHVK